MRTITFSILTSLFLRAATSVPTGSTPRVSGSVDTATIVDHPSKHCKLLSSVTYEGSWGPLFIENSYACDLPPLRPHKPNSNYPVLPVQPYPRPRPREKNTHKQSPLSLPLPPNTKSHLPIDKHQIIDYGCILLPHEEPLEPGRGSTLIDAISRLTNQSCIPPGHLKEYIGYLLPWSTEWAFTNFNRGEEEICDWYVELGGVASALNMYREFSPERGEVDGVLREVLVYGRDKDREELGGQFWCLRYSKRGWEEEIFGKKCLGLELETKRAMIEEEL